MELPNQEPEPISVEVGDATIGALRWPADEGSPIALAVHGITANAWSWAAVARQLVGEVGLIAVDLRGRGMSSDAPDPYGMRRHADDVAAVADSLGLESVAVVGHSMGAYVALLAAERHPATIGELVLVDGGAPLTLPEGIDPNDALDLALGPAIARLDVVWPSIDDYRQLWRDHPAFASGLSAEADRALTSELEPVTDGWRSRVRVEAVRTDGTELLLDEEVRTALDRHDEPIRILRAETGLFAEPPPLLPVELVERYPRHEWITVPGANHYDILLSPQGAGAVADAIRRACGSIE